MSQDPLNLKPIGEQAPAQLRLVKPAEHALQDASPAAAQHLGFEIVHDIPGRMRLHIAGMRDSTEFEQRLLGAASTIAGVSNARTNQRACSLVIEYDPQFVTGQEILSSVRSSDIAAAQPLANQPGQSSRLLPLVAKVAAGAFQAMPPVVQFSLSAAAFASALSGLAITPVMCGVAGVPIVMRATRTAVSEHRISVDGLDGLASLMMMATGQFKAAAFMMSLIGLGEYIRELTANRCQQIVGDLLGMAGASAWLVKGDKRICIPAEQVKPGDTVVVYPGDMIPVDGTVVRGEGLVNQASLTGESAPVEVQASSHVFAATVLMHGQIYIACTAALSSSKAQGVIDLINSAPVSETKIENYAAQLADKAVMPIIGSSLISLAATGSPTRMMSMLIYDFSTGIRISAPTAVLASMAHAGKLGILIKSGSALEKLARVNAVVFDKTGTLTTGSPHVTKVHTLDGLECDRMVALAAAVESRLSHPAAQAIVNYANTRDLHIQHRTHTSHTLGMGVSATVDGMRVLAGSRRLMEHKHIDLSAAAAIEQEAIADGESLAYIAIDGKLCGAIAYADTLRPEAAEAIRKMRRRGIRKIVMATGDIEASAKRIASTVGVRDVLWEAFPEKKAKLVQDLRARGYIVAVVGDGINDSPALAHADVAISLKGGTSAAREHAEVVLTDDNLLRVAQAIDIARGSMTLIKETMGLVAVANGAGLALTAIGLVGPAGATLLNNGSAIISAVNSLRPLLAPGWSVQRTA